MTGAGRGGFSFSKLVFNSLGAGVLLLVVSIPIILLVARWSPVAGLIVAVLAMVAMIAVIGVVSRRMVASAERDILAQQRTENLMGQHDSTDRNTSTDG